MNVFDATATFARVEEGLLCSTLAAADSASIDIHCRVEEAREWKCWIEMATIPATVAGMELGEINAACARRL